MKVGDLVDFEFEDVYTGLVVATNNARVQIYFFEKGTQTYTKQELDDCCWEIISEGR